MIRPGFYIGSTSRHDWQTVDRKVTLTLALTQESYTWMTKLWLTKDRPSLSSERAPHRDTTTNSRPKLLQRKQYLVKRPQSGLDTKTYWLTDEVTLTLVETSVSTTTWTSADANSEQDIHGSSATSEEAQTDCIASVNKVVQQLFF
jgi:hypothetical protein